MRGEEIDQGAGGGGLGDVDEFAGPRGEGIG